jgi:hypothetical protein
MAGIRVADGRIALVVAFMLIISPGMLFAQTAQRAEVIAPVVFSVEDGGSVSLGTIGPGQTLYITIKGKAIGNEGREANWGVLGVLETPALWNSSDSKVLAREMQATVTPDKLAKDGTYRIKLILTECEHKEEKCEAKQGLGAVTFYGVINVKRDVLATSMPKTAITTGVGQPARYDLIIENKGSANDVFEITSEGVPTWSFKKNVHVPAGGKVITFYELASKEEKEYSPTITIKSLSSDELKHAYNISFVSRSDVVGDIRATKNGVLLFPIVLEPLYSLLGIFGYVI